MKLPIVFVALIGCGSLIRCTNILTTKEKQLSVIEVPNKDYKLRIVYYPSNATIQSSIQVRKIFNDNRKEELLKDFERYNYVDTSYLQNGTTLLIVVRDTISYLGNKPDTMIVNFK